MSVGSVLPAGDLACLQAGGAHVQTLALRDTDLRVHGLNVGVPPAAGAPVGVRDRLAEAWPLATNVADGSHVRHSSLIKRKLAERPVNSRPGVHQAATPDSRRASRYRVTARAMAPDTGPLVCRMSTPV